MLARCEKKDDFRNVSFAMITELTIVPERFAPPRSVMLAFHKALQAAQGDGDEW